MLKFDHFSLTYHKGHATSTIIKQVDFMVNEGECVGLVGASGCGKTQLMRACVDLLHSGGETGGKMLWKGEVYPQAKRAQLRGKDIAMMFQDPQSALDPVMSIGKQVMETIRVHHPGSKEEIYQQAMTLLHQVKIADTKRIMKAYPFQLSIGMCQRVMLAMLLAQSQASLWIADEPTSALDVSVQADILDLLQRFRQERNIAMVFITHDLRLLPSLCDRVYIMRDGQIIESCNASTLYEENHEPYTNELLQASLYDET